MGEWRYGFGAISGDGRKSHGALTLLGQFGTRAGSVTVGGAAASVSSWSDSEVVVALQQSGAGASGMVEVDVDGRVSNDVPLTAWEGWPVDYTVDLGSSLAAGFSQSVSCSLHFRADIHEYRTKPGETPIVPEDVPFWVVDDSTCDVTMAGDNSEMSLTGSAAMTWLSPSTDPGTLTEWFSLRGTIDAATPAVSAYFGLGARGTLLLKQTAQTTPYPLIIDNDLLLGGTGTSPPGAAIPLDASFAILANSLTDQFLGQMPTSLTWQTQVPSSPPTP